MKKKRRRAKKIALIDIPNFYGIGSAHFTEIAQWDKTPFYSVICLIADIAAIRAFLLFLCWSAGPNYVVLRGHFYQILPE